MRDRFWITRLAMLKAFAAVYAIAFAIAWNQGPGLIGEHGILPLKLYLERVPGLLEVPTLFWFGTSNTALQAVSGLGLALSVAALAGLATAPVFFALWALYLSIVNVGQLFYGYGWETLLLESGFLAIFLAPGGRPWLFRRSSPPPVPVLWLYRWLIFRVMFGAGLIKIRGDSCWTDLTCMVFHYETQPLPNAVSPWMHALPGWAHRLETLATHFLELVVPWFLLAPDRLRVARHAAGAITVGFQGVLIASGNLSWLNYVTIVIALSCFDDGFWSALLPRSLGARLLALAPRTTFTGTARKWILRALVAAIALLSIRPTLNLVSDDQMMNASFDSLHLVNTYGAFGSITRTRREIVLEATRDDPASPTALWRPYHFRCKPGDPARHPCFVSPYHFKIDWQMWFAAFSPPRSQTWLIHFISLLLEGRPEVVSLIESAPFGPALPRSIRAEFYEYRFARDGSDWWTRRRLGEYLPPVSRRTPFR